MSAQPLKIQYSIAKKGSIKDNDERYVAFLGVKSGAKQTTSKGKSKT